MKSLASAASHTIRRSSSASGVAGCGPVAPAAGRLRRSDRGSRVRRPASCRLASRTRPHRWQARGREARNCAKPRPPSKGAGRSRSARPRSRREWPAAARSRRARARAGSRRSRSGLVARCAAGRPVRIGHAVERASEAHRFEHASRVVDPRERDPASPELRLAAGAIEPPVVHGGGRRGRSAHPIGPGRRSGARRPEPCARSGGRAGDRQGKREATRRQRGARRDKPRKTPQKTAPRKTAHQAGETILGSSSSSKSAAEALAVLKKSQHARAERARPAGPLPLRHGIRGQRRARGIADARQEGGARPVAREHPQRPVRPRGPRLSAPAAHERRTRADGAGVSPLHRHAHARPDAVDRGRGDHPRQVRFARAGPEHHARDGQAPFGADGHRRGRAGAAGGDAGAQAAAFPSHAGPTRCSPSSS